MDATMQGIVGGAFEGAGQAIGSLVGGAVYKWKVSYILWMEPLISGICA